MTTDAVSPAGGLIQEGSIFARASRELRALIHYRELIRYLVQTSLRARSKGRFFGFIWWVLDPLLLMATYVLIVKVIFNRGGPDYPVLVFTSLICYRAVRGGIAAAMTRVRSAQGVMKQVLFPRTAVPIAAVLTEAAHYVFGLAVLFVFAVPFGIYPAPVDLLIIPVFVLQTVIALGLGFLLACLNVFIRDVQNLMTYVFRMAFYLAPGLYGLERVPAEWRKYFYINPLTVLFDSYHKIIVYHQLPNFFNLAWMTVLWTGVLVLGYLVFIRLEHLFNKVL